MMAFEDKQQISATGMCAWCGAEIYQDDDIWYDGFSTYIHDECVEKIEAMPDEAPIAAFIREDYQKTTMRKIIDDRWAREDHDV